MIAQRLTLLRRLAGGEALSTVSLARELRIDVPTLAGELRILRGQGLELEELAGDAVRLRSPMDVLDRDAVLAALGPGARRTLEALDLLFEVGSTNQYLLDLARQREVSRPRACMAEIQSAGRGRGGRPYFSTPGGSVLLSILLPVATAPGELLGLSPAIAVTVARALETEGAAGLGLKWPNDVLVEGRKVCGILLELAQDRRQRPVLVAGIGINVRLAESTGRAIDQPWTDLHRVLGRAPKRNRIAGRVIDRVLEAVPAYMEAGFEAFRREYRSRDVLEGRALRVVHGREELRGIGRGLDPRGALLVQTQERLTALLSGDVSVRPATP